MQKLKIAQAIITLPAFVDKSGFVSSGTGAH